MAPSHLHPRSAATSTLFAGTLLASFVVVAVPHIWPCPRPRQFYTDSEVVTDKDGNLVRRVRRRKVGPADAQNTTDTVLQSSTGSDMPRKVLLSKEEQEIEAFLLQQAEANAVAESNVRRECPVPKPKGAIGRLLGFQDDVSQATSGSAK